jgi:hypothetical protein
MSYQLYVTDSKCWRIMIETVAVLGSHPTFVVLQNLLQRNLSQSISFGPLGQLLAEHQQSHLDGEQKNLLVLQRMVARLKTSLSIHR